MASFRGLLCEQFDQLQLPLGQTHQSLGQGHEPSLVQRARKGDHVFGVKKRAFDNCYRNLARNVHRLEMRAAPTNLFIA